MKLDKGLLTLEDAVLYFQHIKRQPRAILFVEGSFWRDKEREKEKEEYGSTVKSRGFSLNNFTKEFVQSRL